MSLHYDTISGVGEKLRAGQITSVVLTELMLERIETHNKTLNAFITVTAELALQQAGQADDELAQGRDRGPLHGIPVAVKDLFATKDIRTTGGSKLFEDMKPDHDANSVTRLREAGAVLLGKTGLHELAYGTSSINPFFGAIANPWALDHDPGGSSGGSASAVAAGLAYAALGTDTGCSVRQPAHCCGIVGFKPSFGLISKAGVLPLTWTLDHVGPLTRSVEDAVFVTNAIAGHDLNDPYSMSVPRLNRTDANAGMLRGMRIGKIMRPFFDGHADVIEVVERVLETLSARGASIVKLEIPHIDEALLAAHTTFAEAGAIHRGHLEDRPEAFSDEVCGKLEACLNISAADYAQAQHFRRQFCEGMNRVTDGCDIVVAPTSTTTSAPIADRPDDYTQLASRNTVVFNFTGQPSISIPCGFTKAGLPVGLMITGKLFEDETVLKVANAFEQALGFRTSYPAL